MAVWDPRDLANGSVRNVSQERGETQRNGEGVVRYLAARSHYSYSTISCSTLLVGPTSPRDPARRPYGIWPLPNRWITPRTVCRQLNQSCCRPTLRVRWLAGITIRIRMIDETSFPLCAGPSAYVAWHPTLLVMTIKYKHHVTKKQFCSSQRISIGKVSQSADHCARPKTFKYAPILLPEHVFLKFQAHLI